MNAYRIALILCRAVVVALWWSAGVRALWIAGSAVTNLLSTSVIFGNSAGAGDIFSAALLAVAAIFLQTFAASLAASITGDALLEGEAIASRGILEPSERALARAGAGLYLLFFGAANVTPLFWSQVQFLISTGNSRVLFNFLPLFVPSVLQCVVGFILTFQLGLRRVLKAQ